MEQAMRVKTRGDDRGATMVEYSIMVALIAVVAVITVATLGVQVRGLFTFPVPW
jgi:pilus assembly protein Flp/PilA